MAAQHSGAGQIAVAPNTTPTSWYTPSDNVQHVAYVGVDGQIHECFFFIGGAGGWLHNVPSAGQVKVAPGTSPTSWYTAPDNVQHIAYVGTDGLIHECFFFLGAGGGWLHNIPGAGQVAVRPGTSPTSWFTEPDKAQHIAYVGTDARIHECFFFIGAGGGWLHNVPSAGQALAAPNSSPTSWYTALDKVQHIAYVGTDAQIQECFFFVGGGAGWLHSLPAAGQTTVASATSPTSWFTPSDNAQHIAYIGADRLIHECFFFIGAGGGWLHNVLSAGQALVEPATSPTSWYTPADKVQHVAYVGADRLIHECFFFMA